METVFSSRHSTFQCADMQEGTSPAVPTVLSRSLAVEAVLSLALRELFATFVVDQFLLQGADCGCASILMRFRSSRRYTEVLPIELSGQLSVNCDETAALVESHIGPVLVDLFGMVHIDEVSIDVSGSDQLICTITACAPY